MGHYRTGILIALILAVLTAFEFWLAHVNSGVTFLMMVAAVKAATGRKGPALFKPQRCALTGVDHGPELAPLLRLMPEGQATLRLSRYAH